jgi:hypothetical protein
VQFEHESHEFVLVGRFPLVELNDSLLEDVEQGVDAVVVGLLLESSRKTRINRHSYISSTEEAINESKYHEILSYVNRV